MKIAIFAEFPLDVLSNEMAGRGGGHAATWLPQLAKAWEHQMDLDIHWCVLDRTARKTSSVRCWNQTFHRLPAPSISLGLLLARWPQRLACRNIIRQIQPDLIHCWGTETLNGAALQEFGGPSILSMQGIIHTLAKTGDLKGWRWRLFETYEAPSIRRATVVTSESRWGLDRVNEIVAGKQVRQIEYGVFPSFNDVIWAPDPLLPRIFYAGGFGRLKGVDILLEMLKRHPERNWKMVFAGAGNLEPDLRALNDPNVELLGTLRTSQVQEQMSKAWALVLPSRADTSPNVVKEARVVGLPVVASPHGGHAAYIEDYVDGRVIFSEDPDEWFSALDSLCNNLTLCRSMGAVNHEKYREYFRPEITASRFLDLYASLLG